jgi:hypothetical protein
MAMPSFHQSQDPTEKSDQPKGEVRPEEERLAPTDGSRSGLCADSPMPAIPLTPDTLTFRDESGALWWAFEVSGEAVGSSRPTCLLLISGTNLRRVWTYPSDWRSLTPAELLDLPERSH